MSEAPNDVCVAFSGRSPCCGALRALPDVGLARVIVTLRACKGPNHWVRRLVILYSHGGCRVLFLERLLARGGHLLYYATSTSSE